MTDLSQKIAAKAVEQKKNPTIADYLKSHEPEFQRALGKSMDAGKFARDALTAIKASPKLEKADVSTLFGALFLAAQLNLPVGGPLAQFHLTPRTNKGVLEVVPIIGYGGYVKLVMNTGLYSKVDAFLVHERDFFKKGANSERGRFYEHEEVAGDRGPIIGVVAYVKLKGLEETQWTFVSAEDMRNIHRPKYWEGTPWKSHEGEMFKKTGIRALQKTLPKSIESVGLALADQADQATVRKTDGIDDIQVIHDAEVVEEAELPGE